VKRALACLLLVATTQTAFADKVLIMKAEGGADAKIRTRVDTTISKLAAAGTDATSPGEITYTEAAAMVGCAPEEASCRDEVIGMLAVDEIVIVTVTPKSGGFDVQVRRAGKAGAAREASTLAATEQLDRLDAIAPLFGAQPLPGAATDPTSTNPTEGLPDVGQVGPGATLEPTPVPMPMVDRGPQNPHPNRRLHIAGMVTGGVILTLGFISWASAAGVADEIKAYPLNTLEDINAVKALEEEGDGLAGFGNFCFVAGLALGGVSTYFYLRGRSRSRRAVPTTAIAPIITPDSIGLSFGGTL